MSWRGWTILVLIASAIGLIAWDCIAVWRGGGNATISRVLLNAARQYPILPFALGVLIGHLFASQRP